MQPRPFGQTGLTITPIGLGLAALGRPGYINLGHAADLNEDYDLTRMEQHAHVVLDAAWAAGIRYFDAARSYGRAEAFLSSWLAARQIAPVEVTVGSKWGYTYTAAWQVEAEQHEVKEHSLPVLQRQIEESRALLGSHLDVYQIHSATLESGVLENQAVLAALARLREEGLVIGLSLSGPKQAETLKRALDVAVDGRPLFGAVQATWNVLEPAAGAALRQAHEAGLGVIIKEAVANGRLTARNDAPTFVTKRAWLEERAAELNCSLDALALAAVVAQPWADVVLSGATTVAQLQSNVAALVVSLPEEMLSRLEKIKESPDQYWATRSRLAWN